MSELVEEKTSNESIQHIVRDEESVEHGWMEDNPIEEVVIGQDGSTDYVMEDDMLQDAITLEYDDLDAYPSLLPIRDGIPLLTLNLPDLLSKEITFTNNEKMILCFNKKCQKQIAFDGHLYTIENYVSETIWNVWHCINQDCVGSIRSSPTFQELRVRTDHCVQCLPDDHQIRVRIAVYDLRLMAEFTDLALEMLYAGCEARIKSEHPDIAHIFPCYEVLKVTLEDHRINKIYRKRFEMQTLKDKQRKMNMTPDEVVFTESTSGLIKFRRTKPFPTTVCYNCGETFSSGVLPSHDQLISHCLFAHSKQLVIERFEFKEINLFEQYIRELNVYSKFRMKRMGIADENMYFLCALDDRISKAGQGRATKNQEQHIHCTAFIRVFDWRIITKRENCPVTIDYCLEHVGHDEDAGKEELLDFFTPEVFLRDVEDRRQRTQKLLEESTMQRIKRPVEVRSIIPSARIRPVFGSRALAPPLAAQLAGGSTTPYVDAFYDDATVEFRKKYKLPMRSARVEGSKSEERQLDMQPAMHIRSIPSGSRRITERSNFRDVYTFNAVVKIEDACNSFVTRMQNCQFNRLALAYKEKIAGIFRKAANDPALNENATKEDMEKSWIFTKSRGRPMKNKNAEDDEDDEDNENEEDSSEQKGQNQEPAESKTTVVNASTSLENSKFTSMTTSGRVEVEEEDEEEDVSTETTTSPTKIIGRTRKIEGAAPAATTDEEVVAKRSKHSEENERNSPQLGESRSGRARKLPARLVE